MDCSSLLGHIASFQYSFMAKHEWMWVPKAASQMYTPRSANSTRFVNACSPSSCVSLPSARARCSTTSRCASRLCSSNLTRDNYGNKGCRSGVGGVDIDGPDWRRSSSLARGYPFRLSQQERNTRETIVAHSSSEQGDRETQNNNVRTSPYVHISIAHKHNVTSSKPSNT